MVRIGTFSIIATACLLLSACGEAVETGPQLALMNEPQVGLDTYSETTGYKLGAGDKMRIIVFGEPDLSGEFFVDDAGSVDLPLIGDVEAGGATVSEFEQKVVTRFSDGYLRDPKISIEVLNYRPFFIIGEVKSGGEYPYKGGLTVQDAVAIAGGYSYRANERVAFIRRANSDQETRVELSQRVPIFPGDNVRIPERFF